MGHCKPNILWVTLDSVRADHTSLHGYPRDTTPELSRIASSEAGRNFEHAIAQSTRTPVSVPSMLTGLYPSRHRMIGSRSGDALPDEMVTLPEVLGKNGYQTIGVSENGYAGKAKRINERFDEFVKSSPTRLTDFLSKELGTSLLKYPFSLQKHGPGATLDISAHGGQNSFFTTDIAKRKLRRQKSRNKPFFCYVHYNDPHHPYIPPKSIRGEFLSGLDVSPDEAIEFANQMHEKMYKWMAKGLPLSDRDWEILKAMYDSTIKYTDSCVGELFNFIRSNFDDTIVIITADHGDLFGEEGLLGHHIVLHDGLIHVPLVIHGLNEIEQHATKPTQHIDVTKTLLSALGISHDQFQGYDIRNEQREVAISQDLRGTVDDVNSENYERIRQYNPNVDLSHLPQSMVTAARTTDFKLVVTDEWVRLYKLPDEVNEVSEQYPGVTEDLKSFLKNWFDEEGVPFESSPEQPDLDDDVEQHLEEMGYL